MQIKEESMKVGLRGEESMKVGLRGEDVGQGKKYEGGIERGRCRSMKKV